MLQNDSASISVDENHPAKLCITHGVHEKEKPGSEPQKGSWWLVLELQLGVYIYVCEAVLSSLTRSPQKHQLAFLMHNERHAAQSN